jgi:acyl-coenzyme A thioesterase PaaI-like protein
MTTTTQHHRRLEHLYRPSHLRTPDAAAADAAVAYGKAEVRTRIAPPDARTGAAPGPVHRLLSDAAALAAGSLVKDRFVAAQQFNVRLAQPDYHGPVRVVAQVLLSTPPSTTVTAVVFDAEGELVAVATGVYAPTAERLPALDRDALDASPTPALTPASFGAIAQTPVGPVHLN